MGSVSHHQSSGHTYAPILGRGITHHGQGLYPGGNAIHLSNRRRFFFNQANLPQIIWLGSLETPNGLLLTG
jgi:hypothetical protein